MPTCSTCNYESPGSAKFCRQCGAPLFAENDLSGASTRNYGRQAPAPAVAVSAPLPPSVADVVGADTARHYQPPQAFVQPVSNTAPINTGGSKLKSWQLVAFILLVLFVGIGIGAFLAPGRRDHRAIPPLPPEEMGRLNAEAQMHAQQQLAEHMREMQNQARELAQHAAGAGIAIAPAPGDVQPLDLNEYEYPGATIGSYSRLPGNEMMQLRTKDPFDAIRGFYQKKLGKPLLFINDGDDDRSLVFQSNTAPTVVVTVNHDDDSDGWVIVVTRAPFQIAQPELPQPPVGVAKP